MEDKVLGLLGLMRRANALQVGEDNTGAAVKAGKAKLLLLAEDASDNARRRAQSFTEGRNVETVPLPYTKERLAESLGAAGCSMLAATDLGFANALMKLLSERDAVYSGAQERTEARFLKAQRRKGSNKRGEQEKRKGRTNA